MLPLLLSVLGDSVVSSLLPLSEAQWFGTPTPETEFHTLNTIYLRFISYFHYSSVQGEETMMVERESKAHCLSRLADEKWQVSFFSFIKYSLQNHFLTDICCVTFTSAVHWLPPQPSSLPHSHVFPRCAGGI